jgi:hypothetical protein
MIYTFTTNDFYTYKQHLYKSKKKQRPENKVFDSMPNERDSSYGYKRRCTRPWDNCWFSNKPDVICLTIEQACSYNPSYMKWIYKNLTYIKWSVYSIRILEKL